MDFSPNVLLLKRHIVMDIAPASVGNDGQVCFETAREYAGSENTYFCMDQTVWEDMSQPTTITVTVEVGDTLN